MANSKTDTEFTSGFRLKMHGNLATAIRWVEWMLSPSFPEEILKRWKLPSHLDRLVKIGQSVIEEQIYKIGSSGEDNIKRSVSAIFTASGATAYLEPSEAEAVGPIAGMDASRVNYAAFFERTEFNSFIMGKGNDVFNPIKHRPFFDTWSHAFKEEEERQFQRAIYSAMQSKMPRGKAKA